MSTNPEFPSIAWNGRTRSHSGPWPKRYIVWHATANPTSTALGEARYSVSRTDGVGLHLAADQTSAWQALETGYGTGHVGSTVGNRHGIAVECCGTLASSTEHWRGTIRQAAPFVRAAMAKHGIPNRWLTIAQMRDGSSKGHVTHDMARIAWGGTDHTDPGPNFPKQYVIDTMAGSNATGGNMTDWDTTKQCADGGSRPLWQIVLDVWAGMYSGGGAESGAQGAYATRFPRSLSAQIKTTEDAVDSLALGGVDPAAVASLVVDQLGPLLPTLSDVERIVREQVRAELDKTHLTG